MRLYHGTNSRAALAAMERGLLPRCTTGLPSHWMCESEPSHVYLTTAYAPYFAGMASNYDNGDWWAIIEVESDRLDQRNLRPDEDWLEQVSRGSSDWCAMMFEDGVDTSDMGQRVKWFREHLDVFSHKWLNSLEGLGNCCHFGAIPREAITRIAFHEPGTNLILERMACDPVISTLNYLFMGKIHRALTRWFAGYDNVSVDDVDPTLVLLEPKGELAGLVARQRAYLVEALGQRARQQICCFSD